METFQKILEKELEILNDSLEGTKYHVRCKRENDSEYDFLNVSLNIIDGNKTRTVFELDFYSKFMAREYYKIISGFYSSCIHVATNIHLGIYHSDEFSDYTYIASSKVSKKEAIVIYKFWKAIVNSIKMSVFFCTRYNTDITLYTRLANNFDVEFVLNLHVKDVENKNDEKRRRIISEIKFYLKKALEKI